MNNANPQQFGFPLCKRVRIKPRRMGGQNFQQLDGMERKASAKALTK